MAQLYLKTQMSLEGLSGRYPNIKNFRIWSQQREKTICKLRELQKKIDSVCQVAGIAQEVSTVIGLIGGVTGIVGVALKLAGNDSASKVLDASKTMGIVGIGTSVSASLLELGISEYFKDEIERELQKDIELSKPLSHWLECTHQLNSLLRELFDCNVQDNIIKDVTILTEECLKILETGQYEINQLIKNISNGKKISCLNLEDFSEDVLYKVRSFLKKIQSNKELQKSVLKICNIFNKHPSFFILTKFGVKLYTEMQRTNGGVCDIINIAFDTVSLIFTEKVDKKRSIYSKKLDLIIPELNEQLSIMHRKYPELNFTS